MKRRIISASCLAMGHDIIMAALSFACALYLRLGDDWSAISEPYFMSGMALFVLVCASVFSYMRLYRGVWHFASVEDLIAISKAVTLAILVFAFLMFAISRLDGFPRSALIINWLLLIFMLGAPRFAYRLYKDRGLRFALKREDPSIPIVLYGSDHSTELFVRDTLRNHESLYRVLAIIDHNAKQTSRTLHGIKIYNTSLALVLRKLERQHLKAQRLVIADDIGSDKMQELMADADAHGLTLSRLPRIDQLQKQRSTVALSERLKPIDIEDLLGRPQATRDRGMMQDYIGNKHILITGAGGSIGSELCRQLASFQPASLILLDHSEFALYKMDEEIRRNFPDITTHAILADVRDIAAINSCMKQRRPDVIFHAAAIKHVPLSEENPVAAVHTNVIGTRNMLKAAEDHHVHSMVMISTDKAVHPTNVMGASKRLAERVFLSQPVGSTSHVTVRFGNVLGSAGSVVPLFEEQLARGGPLTVTHPDITRYFMTIREAVDLVIHAAALANSSKEKRALYVLDMGEPILISTLAKQMIRLSGLNPDEDIQIEYTGLRPGEKLFEELFYKEESPAPTDIPGILQSSHLPAAPENFAFQLNQLEAACADYQTQAVLSGLGALAPEYKN